MATNEDGYDVTEAELPKPKRFRHIRLENGLPRLIVLEVQVDKTNFVIVRAIPKKKR